jgi:hypothetical protein
MNEVGLSIRTDCDLEADHICYRPAGLVSLDQAVDQCKQAIRFARSNGFGRLLIDSTRLGGFASPNLAERYWIARAFAEEAQTHVIVAFTLQSDLLDPERFGVTVATNLGMRTNAFSTKSEALVWLQAQPIQTKPALASGRI